MLTEEEAMVRYLTADERQHEEKVSARADACTA